MTGSMQRYFRCSISFWEDITAKDTTAAWSSESLRCVNPRSGANLLPSAIVAPPAFFVSVTAERYQHSEGAHVWPYPVSLFLFMLSHSAMGSIQYHNSNGTVHILHLNLRYSR